MAIGRPSDFTPELADTILNRLSLGDSLVSICRNEGMPQPATIYRWLTGDSANPEMREAYSLFRDRYAHARSIQAETKFEQISDIAYRVLDGDVDPNAGRVAIDALKWAASKLAPAKYGDRIEHVLKPARVEDMTDEELARIAGTALLITSQGTQDETPPEYPGKDPAGGGSDG